MKQIKIKLFMSISVLIIGFLIGTSLLNTISTQALLDTNENQYNIDSFDRFDWKWSATEVVSNESTSDSLDSSITVDSAGNVHIIWMDSTDYLGAGSEADIFYKRWDTKLLEWTITEVISTETETQGGSFYPSLAVDSAGNVHVSWTGVDLGGTANDYQIFYKRWNASSSTWTSTELVSSESSAYSAFPSLVVDYEENVHIAWLDQTDYLSAGGDEDIFYKKLDVTSSAWTTAEVISTESSAYSTVPSMTVDSFGNIHIAWQDQTDYLSAGGDEDIFYKKWDDTLSTWTTTQVVSTESTDNSDSPSLALDSSGNIHIAWMDFTDYTSSVSNWDVFYKKWDATFSTWTTTQVVSTESTAQSIYPSLAIDSTDCVNVVWHDSTSYTGSGADWDIGYKRWNAFSSTWTETNVVSTESTADSLYPAVGVDSAGNIYISWHDYTNLASSGNDVDIFYKKFSGPPSAPELAFIVPNPTDVDFVFLDWNNVSGASDYYVYCSDYYIWSVEEIIPIDTVNSSSYIDTLPYEGYFYYVIVAGNFAGNSSHSNCQYVEYRLPHVREFSIITGLILGALVVSIVIMRTRKNKLK